MRRSFVPFHAIHAVGDELVAVEEPAPEFARRLRQVLDFYEVPWHPGENGTVMVPASVAADLDTCWNYTSKANDEEWLEHHRAE